MASDTPSERLSALRCCREWFDVDDAAAADIVAKLVVEEDLIRRMDGLLAWRAESPTVRYADLARRIRSGDDFRWEDVDPPKTSALLGRYRLSEVPSDAMPAAVARGATVLLAELGLESACERLFALPCPLPSAIAEEFQRQDVEARTLLLLRLSNRAVTPMARFHVVRLLLDVGHGQDAEDAIHAHVDHLVSSGLESCRAFVTLLKRADEEIGGRTEVAEWTPSVRLLLAWVHANEVHSIFGRAGVPDKWTVTRLARRDASRLELFDRMSLFRNDVACPITMDGETLMFYGLAHALGSGGVLRVPVESLRRLRDVLGPAQK